MPTPTEGLLKSPLMTLSLWRNGPSGVSVELRSISQSEPDAHQCFGLIPLPTKRAAKRFGKGPADSGAGVALPQTGSDSSQGKVMVTPAPRRKVRRLKLIVPVLPINHFFARSSLPSRLFRNCSLVTILSTRLPK